jgi:hypothetical protein
MKTLLRTWQYLAEFFLEWEMFQTKVAEKIKTHILCSVTFFRRSHRLWDNAKNFGGTWWGHKWRKNMAYTLCMLAKQRCIHTRTCTCARVPTRTHAQANMWYLLLFHSNHDSRKRLDFTLYVHCLYCFWLSCQDFGIATTCTCKMTCSSRSVLLENISFYKTTGCLLYLAHDRPS